MKAKDIMSTNIVSCHPDTSVKDAARLMTLKGFSSLPVVNGNNEIRGIISASDFIGKEIEVPHAMASMKRLLGQNFYRISIEDIYKKTQHFKVSQIMTTKLNTVTPETSIDGVVKSMIEKHHKRLPVVDNGVLVGMITRKDLLKAFILV
ncbi:MAG: hypothetical protein COW00_07725 [Bdellovibrio sp. CG12_big_fil_rev_8_21_14_0_65_39_13]|nr:MAG: hypothetical protein COW78_12405 [Bdellovibrio sp. CG22_combo_CG10-13_8_21_14_all_39_27]PIQ60145.1 MAG: hypothetical protein COW00_07725 [Bdellovibrio sp. CG12_big_fil_rev_8_21_14_0_65_39_13]PIR36780.1 MAG: hypothetical protein COV37_01225 [Bdellovibrio sp. CG11_big_fil_rev_8_21_14_0_20_39_38]PJB54042.1 MAG: hypothetical protein CO099_03815 [Bdellovibrio sp. CG_4_9_14_3_um_filter_39_7]